MYHMPRLTTEFFDRDAQTVAKDLLGKVVRHRCQGVWLSAMIIETEAYYLEDKASHASLGFTEKRKALFMPAGTIYMYYARGGDSLNISCRGEGNAVLIKSGVVYPDEDPDIAMVQRMQAQNLLSGDRLRPLVRLCSGQTLLCRSLGLKVPEWDQKRVTAAAFRMDDVGYKPSFIIQTTRLGIPLGRDEHLPYRFVDEKYRQRCTLNPRNG
jgi:DNA-3-methyladenine glycosylase